MPATAARDHHTAVLALLRALPTPPAALVVFDAEGPVDEPITGPYAVVYVTGGNRTMPTMRQDYRRVETTHQISCVGSTADECLWAVDRAMEILGQTPTIPGRSAAPVRFVSGALMRRDDSIRNPAGRPLFTAVLDIAVTSTPT